MRSDWYKRFLPALCGSIIIFVMGSLFSLFFGIGSSWNEYMLRAVVTLGITILGGCVAGLISPVYHWLAGAIAPLPMAVFGICVLCVHGIFGKVMAITLFTSILGITVSAAGGFLGGILRNTVFKKEKE